MGFYGNITNTNSTQFVFDRTYPNRSTMDNMILKDSIYLGRYVLIEYDLKNDNTLDSFSRVYTKDNKTFYLSIDCTPNTMAIWAQKIEGVERGAYEVYTDEIVYLRDNENTPEYTFFKCIGKAANSSAAAFEKIIDNDNSSPYVVNYNIDINRYGNGRGYDSTVWQKVYTEGKEKFVMIAELNSVVPTFGLSVDPPTMSPLVPHFDANSTDVYYNLHVQPQWGLQVAAAEDKELSDSATKQIRENYNVETGQIEKWYNNGTEWVQYTDDSEVESIPAAIYFNEKAFDPTNKNGRVKGENYITVLPTGKSEIDYNSPHAGASSDVKDIQEIRIHLPEIGNVISDVHDIVHGVNRDDYAGDPVSEEERIDSLQGRLNSFRDLERNQIPIKRISDGTIVGTTINGGVNYELSEEGILSETIDVENFASDDPWIYTQVDSDNENGNSISIHHNFHKTKDTQSSSDLNSSDTSNIVDNITLYTPYIDAAGHVVGCNVETVTLPFGYKVIKTNGSSTTGDGDLDKPGESTFSALNTQDTLIINTGNKWIQIEAKQEDSENVITFAHEIHEIDDSAVEDSSDLNGGDGTIIIPDISYDAAGHIISSKPHTYILPYGYKIIKVSNSGETGEAASIENKDGQIADSTQDTITFSASNKWIKLDNDSDDTIQFGHILTSGKNKSGTSYGMGEDVSQAASFNVPAFTFDEAGHIVDAKTSIYTMPYSFVNITSKNSDNTGTPVDATIKEEKTLTAKEFNGSYTIGTKNRWLAIDIDNNEKIINISHRSPSDITSDQATTSTVVNNREGQVLKFGDSFKLPIIHYDNAGHISAAESESIILPTPGLVNEGTSSFSTVVTKIALTAADGQITQTFENAGNLTLTGYSRPESTNNLDITATDSINAAFGKIEKSIRTMPAYAITPDQISNWDQAEANVQVDWAETSSESDAFILNKPDLTNMVETTTEFGDGEEKHTIESMLNLILELRTKVIDLEGRLAALESKE